MATMGLDTSAIARRAASFASTLSSSICSWTASTTTMASSTTSPTASTSPNNVSVLSEKPRMVKDAVAPTSETGTAMAGISVALQFWRNTKTTIKTRTNAINSVFSTS